MTIHSQLELVAALEARQDELIQQLDQLNGRIEDALKELAPIAFEEENRKAA